MLRSLGADPVEVRLPSQLDPLDCLIIPGGESTTIARLCEAFDLVEPLRAFGKERAIWGTCAGAIFLSVDALRDQTVLGLMDITVERNAFGRQAESFEVDLEIPALDGHDNGGPRANGGHGGTGAAGGNGGPRAASYHAIFIRAPLIREARGTARPLATLADGRIVAAQQGKLLATSFHPELTSDTRVHQYFLKIAAA